MSSEGEINFRLHIIIEHFHSEPPGGDAGLCKKVH